MTYQLFGDEKSVKNTIILILSSEQPLTARKVYNRIKNQGFSVTYHAVYKTLKLLSGQDVLEQKGKEYKLSIAWINEIEKYGKKLKEAYLKKEEIPYLEVGCGSSVEKDGFEAGKEAAEKAVNEIKFYKNFNLALAFISSEYEEKFKDILNGIYSVIGDTQLIGCTGVGEFKDKRLKGSIVITLVASKNFNVDITIIKDINEYSNDYNKAAEYLIRNNSITKPSFGIIFVPGFCESNDMVSTSPYITDALKKVIHENFPIIGGQAGDEWKFKKTYQFHNRDVYSSAVVLALVKTNLKFGVNGKSAYKPLNNKTYRIKVENNCITEMAHNDKKLLFRPAVSFYEKEIGISHNEFTRIFPMSIKEMVSQNVVCPIADINDPTIVCYPIKITNGGIRFEYDFDNNAIIQISNTTNEFLLQTVNNVVNETIMTNEIKKPRLVLVFPCCIFEAILSKTDIKEIEELKKQSILTNCRITGTYVYGEIGVYEGKTKWGSCSVVCLVIGDELRE